MPLDRGPSPLRPPPFGGMASYHVEPMSPVDKEFHPVFHAGAVAVITGAASGIGRAAAQELAKCVQVSHKTFIPDFLTAHGVHQYFLFRLGLKIALADIEESKLYQTGKEISTIAGDANVLVVPTDVSKIEEVVRLRDRVYEAWGEVRLRTHI